MFLARLWLSFPAAPRGPGSSPVRVGCGGGHACPPGGFIVQRVPPAPVCAVPPSMAFPPRSPGGWEHCPGGKGVHSPAWSVPEHCTGRLPCATTMRVPAGATAAPRGLTAANAHPHPPPALLTSKGAGITETGLPTAGFAAPRCMWHIKVPRRWGEPQHHLIFIPRCCEHQH